MVKLKIDNIEYEVQETSTILDVARDAGFEIPTLCYENGLPHYSSCMICMVRDRRNNSFLPSCSALIQDGMDIDVSGDEVISLRQKAIELLLSEHRAECEAPCKVVCPSGYNIPLLNRFLSDGNFESAIKLSLAETGSEEIMCINCAAYCENACRRKKVDTPVSIRNLKIFIDNKIIKQNPASDNTAIKNIDIPIAGPARKNEKLPKRFMSYIGRLEEKELKEWLKECEDRISRYREISDDNTAIGESGNCMHCDCRAASDCQLRYVADKYSVKDPRGKLVNALIEKKINHKTGLIFENAKCIKCGLCVRLCEDLKEEPALCFMQRGFVSIISEPLTTEFDNVLLTRSNEVIEICPTGALSQLKEKNR